MSDQTTALDLFVADVRSVARSQGPLICERAAREDVVDDAVRAALWLHKYDIMPGEALQDPRYIAFCNEQDRLNTRLLGPFGIPIGPALGPIPDAPPGINREPLPYWENKRP